MLLVTSLIVDILLSSAIHSVLLKEKLETVQLSVNVISYHPSP